MIDFNKQLIFKLKPVDTEKTLDGIKELLITGEELLNTFKTTRDQVVFTNKRVIATNVQGITGKKIDYTSIPYNKIQTYSVETAGTFDRDAEIELYVSSVGKIKFDIKGSSDIVALCKTISEFVLK